MSTSNKTKHEESATMEDTLAKAKSYMQASDYPRAIVLLQRARNLCKCISAFRQKYNVKEHSSAKPCLKDSLLSAALLDNNDEEAVYKTATGLCSCGGLKLSCDNAVHMDVLDKLAACTVAMKKHEAAIGFAAAAIHLNPKSPVGYCRLSKILRTKEMDPEALRADVDSEVKAYAIVRHGEANVRNHGDVQHPLYQVLKVLSRKLYRRDPLRVFPPELKVMILSHLDTLELVRSQRVSKRWLFAIRDDPNVWKRLVFVLTSRSKTSVTTKGILKVINRAKKAYTLSISPALLGAAPYDNIFSHLKNLRHLHLEFNVPAPSILDISKPPQHLTRLTWFMGRYAPIGTLMTLLRGSASTLEELQVAGSAVAALEEGIKLPKLKVLRMSAGTDSVFEGYDVYLDVVGEGMPNLEQLCFDGSLRLTVAPASAPLSRPLWPELKVLVLGWGVKVLLPYAPGSLNAVVPPSIQVLDCVGFDPSRFFKLADDSTVWPNLQFFRLGAPIQYEQLSRLLTPSLENGNLKTLSLTLPVDQRGYSNSAPQELLLPNTSYPHVQALGLAFDDMHMMTGYLRPHCMSWVAKFPNVHTFTVSGGGGNAAVALAELVLRPGTKRIFDSSLRGVDRDQILLEAHKRKVEVIKSDGGFPVMFPWRLDDDDVQGKGKGLLDEGEEDVVERWKGARGRLTKGSFRVSNQPFFRE